MGDFVWVWQEGVWVFGVDMVFYCMVVNYYFILFDGQWLVGCDMQLFFDQVNVGDYFSYWMFYLDMGVYFNEVEFVVFEQEFKGICFVVVDIYIGFCVMFVDVVMQFWGDVWCWCFFDYFLMMVLYGVVVFSQIDCVILIICQYLNFNVVWVFQVFFYVDYVVVESCFGFCFGYGDGLCQFSVVMYNVYIVIVVVVGGFDDYWIVDVFGMGVVSVYVVVQWVIRIWNGWNVSFFYGGDGGYFVVYQVDSVGFWVDEDEIGMFNLFSKISVFREEVIIWVNCYCVSDFSGVDNGWNVQIVFYGWSWIDVDCFIC